MRWLPLIGVALLLGGCASKPTGNEFGGLVMEGQAHLDRAFREAQEHCQQYGKSARLTGVDVHDKSNDPVAFECLRAHAAAYESERRGDSGQGAIVGR